MGEWEVLDMLVVDSNLKRMDFDLSRMAEMQQLKQRLNELRDMRREELREMRKKEQALIKQLEEKKRRADEIASSYVEYSSTRLGK